MDNLIVNDEPDLIDNTGVMNYLHLTHAKPAEDEKTCNFISCGDAFTSFSIDAEFFQNSRAIGYSNAENQRSECDDRLIKQIIEKGRFVNKIAQAMHKEQETDIKYELPENLEGF